MPWVEGPDGVWYYYKITFPVDLLIFLDNFVWDIFGWHIDLKTPLIRVINWVLDFINDLWDWYYELALWWEDFRQEVVDFFTQIPAKINEVWQFLLNFFDNMGNIISNWWDTTKSTVLDWIDEAKTWAAGLIDDLRALVDKVTADFEDFIGTTLPTLASKLDVRDLVTAALLPFRDIINFLETVKDELTRFFADPWAWLYNKFDDFFERFW